MPIVAFNGGAERNRIPFLLSAISVKRIGLSLARFAPGGHYSDTLQVTPFFRYLLTENIVVKFAKEFME